MELKKIKLNKLSDDALAQRQLKALKGGAQCICACAYANRGGSSTMDNGLANRDSGRYSPEGGTYFLPDVDVYGRKR
nr:TIGR04149 family rSAM-modified RiPP [uncultured Porphyromonas sp.]